MASFRNQPKMANQESTKVSTINKSGSLTNKMSHSVTVTRTTTTSTSTAILINTGYLKTGPGLLKLFEVIIAAICLFLAFYFDFGYFGSAGGVRSNIYEFYICVMSAALIGSSCILLGCLLSLSTASILTKTLFELIFHSVMFGLTLASSICLFFETKNRRVYNEDKITAGAVLGIILSILYLVSTVFAFRSYRGL